MDELIARIEAASGPDRELDCRILCADKNWHFRKMIVPENNASHVSFRTSDGDKSLYYTPKYTASVDAALTLVPDGMLWMVTNTGVDDPHKPDFSKATAVVADWRRSASEGGDRSAATPALALCAAALRARAT